MAQGVSEMDKYYEPIEHEVKHPETVMLPNDESFAYSSNWNKLFYSQKLSFSIDQWIEDGMLDSLSGLDVLRSFCGNFIVSQKFCSIFNDCDLSFSPARLTTKDKFLENRIGMLGEYFVVLVRREVKIINESLRPMHFWPKLKRFKSEEFVIDQPMPFESKIVRDFGFNDMLIVNEDFVSIAVENKLVMGFREYPVVPEVFSR